MNRKILFQPARRSFLLNATSLAAMAILPKGIARAAPDEPRDLLLYANFEQATLAEAFAPPTGYQCTWRQQGNSAGITLSRDFARRGEKSFRSWLSNGGGALRAEILGSGGNAQIDNKSHLLDMFQTHWYGFSVYIPAPWDGRSITHELIHQIHGGWPGASHPNQWNRSPWLAIYIGSSTSSYPDRYRIVGRYCSVHYNESTKADQRTGFSNDTISMLPDVGRWTDWVVQYRPDYRPNNEGGNGLTKIWKDGQLIVDYSGPNFENSDYWAYVKFGLYKDPWGPGVDNDPVMERTYYYDEVRVSRPNVGSYALVAPRGNSDAEPAIPTEVGVT